MAVAALLLWLCTAAVGSYLLATAAHASGNAEPEPPAQLDAGAGTCTEEVGAGDVAGAV